MTALFEDIIFGPIRSRRLGLSLGVNLLPEHAKICSFDCIYCECGSNSERRGEAMERRFADIERVKEALKERLTTMCKAGEIPNVITFAGNGEPTMHPQFEQIIEYTISIRDQIAPTAKISVLSNATMLHREGVVRALKAVDNNILKIDSAIQRTAELMDRPAASYSVENVATQISQFGGEAIIQTMFLRGEVAGEVIDNTTEEEISAWLKMVQRCAPRQVMIYSIDRDTPCQGLTKIEREELLKIAERLEAIGIECSVA